MLSSRIWAQSELSHLLAGLHGIGTVAATLCTHRVHCRRGSARIHEYLPKLSVPLTLLGPYQPQQGKVANWWDKARRKDGWRKMLLSLFLPGSH